MKIRCVWEHNGEDTLLYAANLIGAFTRGANREEAVRKMQREAVSYLRWTGVEVPASFEVEITQEKVSDLNICDADSDVIFEEERHPLTMEEYTTLKALVMKSADDFWALYSAIPEKDSSCLLPRRTFYGQVPTTASEMYEHTKSVNSYYFAEIGVDADSDGTIAQCRERGFAQLEKHPDFLNRPAAFGSYGEEWSLRKVMRRFVWHDRIHAKAMYRMAKKTFGAETVPDIFALEE